AGIGGENQGMVGNADGRSDTITFGSGARVPNALAFDSGGNLYVSDSFQGAVFKITNPESCAPNCNVTTFNHDPLLATAGFPPFRAHRLALHQDASPPFISHTTDTPA